jgi:hypothetical protein
MRTIFRWKKQHEDLKRAFQDEIAVISQDQNLLQRVFDNFVDRISQGGHLHDVIRHK